jgi:hypothetical protein
MTLFSIVMWCDRSVMWIESARVLLHRLLLMVPWEEMSLHMIAAPLPLSMVTLSIRKFDAPMAWMRRLSLVGVRTVGVTPVNRRPCTTPPLPVR